jgi:hypothetical protein
MPMFLEPGQARRGRGPRASSSGCSTLRPSSHAIITPGAIKRLFGPRSQHGAASIVIERLAAAAQSQVPRR